MELSDIINDAYYNGVDAWEMAVATQAEVEHERLKKEWAEQEARAQERAEIGWPDLDPTGAYDWNAVDTSTMFSCLKLTVAEKRLRVERYISDEDEKSAARMKLQQKKPSPHLAHSADIDYDDIPF